MEDGGIMKKTQLRGQLFELRSSSHWLRETEKIAAHLNAFFKDNPVEVLALYWPIRSEIDLRACAVGLKAQGLVDELAMPAIVDNHMQFVRWSPGEVMERDSAGIPMPKSGHPVSPDCILVPCVGLTASGHRLGYGAGWYDRTLNEYPQALTIGVLAQAFMVKNISAQSHDVALNAYVTEEGLFPCRELPANWHFANSK